MLHGLRLLPQFSGGLLNLHGEVLHQHFDELFVRLLRRGGVREAALCIGLHLQALRHEPRTLSSELPVLKVPKACPEPMAPTMRLLQVPTAALQAG